MRNQIQSTFPNCQSGQSGRNLHFSGQKKLVYEGRTDHKQGNKIFEIDDRYAGHKYLLKATAAGNWDCQTSGKLDSN